MIFNLGKVLVLGLTVLSEASRATNYHSFSRRGLAVPQKSDRIPAEITIGGKLWTRGEIETALTNIFSKPFTNRVITAVGVSQNKLFQDAPDELVEYDLVKDQAGNVKISGDSNMRTYAPGAHRAIVKMPPANKPDERMFVGIASHGQTNGVFSSLWDVEKMIKDGAYIALEGQAGHLPPSWTVSMNDPQSNQKVTFRIQRNEIADAMDKGGGIKDKADGSFKKPIKVSKPVRNIVLVHKKNRFVRLEDASGNPLNQPAFCKRDVEGACGPPVQTSPDDPAGQNSEKNPKGNDDGEKGELDTETAGEATKDMKGDFEPPKITMEITEAAERYSKDIFADLASKRGLTEKVNKWSMSLEDVRKKIGYQRLTPESAKFVPSKSGSPGLSTGSVLVVAGVGFWVNGMIEAFTHNTTSTDRWAAGMSIVPVFGCGFQAAADVEHGEPSPIGTLLCVISDALLFTPAWPVGLAIQITNTIWKLVQNSPRPPKPTPEGVKLQRDEIWKRYLNENLYKYIYSHPNLYGNQNTSFSTKFNDSLAARSLAVLSEGAQRKGAARAVLLAASKPGTESPDSSNNSIRLVDEGFDAAMDTAIVHDQRQLLLHIANTLLADNQGSIHQAAKNFDKKLLKELEFNEKRKGNSWPIIQQVPEEHRQPNEATRQLLEEIAKYLEQAPAKEPNIYDIAYIIGQSKSMAALNPRALDLIDYLNTTAPGQSESNLHRITLHQVVQVARVLRGNISEQNISTKFPTNDHDGAKNFQILAAMKFGRVQDDLKQRDLDTNPAGTNDYLATHPFASPAEKNLEETDQLALVSTLPYFLTENLRGLQRVTHSQAISTFLEKADKGWQKSPMQWIIEIEKTKRENAEREAQRQADEERYPVT
ncbi:hypothetical protein QQS21_000432 [Conoideocrella luteorostrata]|uniref:Uncharacterized protein n=1 Tax=Conoideocrella luteorostrata TaxID=1105319 RepID=A0AAJ0FYH3_9HYPO|nr:hypothetical protein QQS21_000432 [Conoideocrella luteorostrata]